MKKRWIVIVAVVSLVLTLAGCCNTTKGDTGHGTMSSSCSTDAVRTDKIVKAAFDGGEAIIALNNDRFIDSLLNSLPVVLQLQDRNGVTKIASFSPEACKGKEAPGMKPGIGDIALNVRTGEVIVYCRDDNYSPDLLPVGHVTSGLDKLFAMKGTFQVYLIRVK